jgi:hypothetical protein
MPDEQHLTATGREIERIEPTVPQRLGHLDLDPERLTSKPRRIESPHLGTGKTSLDPRPELRERSPRGPSLAFPLLGQPARRIVPIAVLGLSMSQ